MPRDIGLYLEDMIEASARLASYTDGIDFDGFSDDSRTIDAVVRNLEILGEAAKQVPEHVRERRQPSGRLDPWFRHGAP